ncbi:MAG: Hsp70 family protein [Treponema sp.]|jgi:molecular chaperone DnaK|nr:Hsp70 family protein [Treponema sp.]
MSRIIGIDLGTSTSEAACIVNGAPKLIPNTLGKCITPSVVHIAEDGGILVGESAAEYLFTRPDCTFMEVKRLTGSGEILRAHGKEYSPEEIQSMLLRYLAGCAETWLGEKISRAVITVPAYFTDAQRRATAKAGELAALNVERILNEPTAAALDYGLANLKECRNVLVYDLGGGTLDVTVLELFEGVIDVKASRGNNHLGGKDFDEIIMAALADSGGDERARMRLKKAAEDCKIALSTGEAYQVSLPFLLTAKDGKPISVEKTVSRAEFEVWIREKVESTREPMLTALSDAGLSPADMDVILLVGGSTRIPCVRRLVEESMSAASQSLVDPDLTVARGAAIQAGLLEGSIADGDLVLTDVCPYTLGIASMHEGLYDDRLLFDPIILRNTTIPAEKSKLYHPFTDFQTSVTIEAYQGDSSDIEDNEKLGEVHLTGIPPARRGKEPIEVVFAYDINGILQVKASVVSTGKNISADINTTGVKPRPALDLTKWESANGARQYRPAIRKAEKKIAEGYDENGDLQIVVRRIKEALLLEKGQQAASLRNDLLELLELMK